MPRPSFQPPADQPPDDEFGLLRADAEQFGVPWLEPAVERRDVAVGGSTVSTLVWGRDRPRVALLHGGGLNAHTWDVTALALGAPLVAVDLPGHGDSSWRDDADYRPEIIAAPIVAALAELAPDPVVLAGQSLGGLTGIVAAAEHPGRFTHLVLIDVSPGLVIEDANQVRDFLAGPESFASRDEIVDRALDFGFGPNRAALERGVYHNTRVRPDGRVEFKHHLAHKRERAAAFSIDFRALWEPLERLAVPVTLIRGDRGFLSEVVVEELLERVPGSRAVTLAAGHNVQEDAPLDLAAELATALAAAG